MFIFHILCFKGKGGSGRWSHSYNYKITKSLKHFLTLTYIASLAIAVIQVTKMKLKCYQIFCWCKLHYKFILNRSLRSEKYFQSCCTWSLTLLRSSVCSYYLVLLLDRLISNQLLACFERISYWWLQLEAEENKLKRSSCLLTIKRRLNEESNYALILYTVHVRRTYSYYVRCLRRSKSHFRPSSWLC